MSEEKWLWSQPQTWHDINRALHDISVLLEYLGKTPDARLLSYFKDTQDQVGEAAAKRTVPPCSSYTEFLNLIFQISSAFQTGRPDLLPALPTPSDHQAPLSATGFVYWSRDFLSAVAAPATADSIRLTHDYIIRRARSRRWLPWRRRAAAEMNARLPALPPDPEAPVRKTLAHRLARWVQISETITIAVVVLTMAISIYALSGRLVLDNAQDMEAAWSKLDAQIEAQEDRLLSSPILPAGDRDRVVAVGLCDYVRESATDNEKPTPVRKVAESPVPAAIAPAADSRSDPSGDLVPAGGVRGNVFSARQMHLCAETSKVLLNLFTVTMHLQTWSSVATERIGEDWTIDIAGHEFRWAIPLAPLLGVSSTSIAEYAGEKDGGLCKQVAPALYDETSKAQGCRKLLLTLINKTHRIAQSILGSITEYILPVCYGFLGAMAATLRMIRRKVDASLLTYTDRARLQQGAILGILCGGVIGLFASYIGKGDAASGLGLSAFALLAGYNVDGVFRFVDELSDRIFQPTAAPKA
jgi:hypothetical protein